MNVKNGRVKNWTKWVLFDLVKYSKSFTSHRQTTTGIARMLGVSRASVITAIEELTTISDQGKGPWIAAISIIGSNGQKVGWKLSKPQ